MNTTKEIDRPEELRRLRRNWIGHLVRTGTQTLNETPNSKITEIYYSQESDTWVALTQEHIREGTPSLLELRLRSLSQPVRTTGRLSFGRYEIRRDK